MMKAIGLTGRENENQAIIAAQLLDRLTARGINVSVCLGIITVEHANVIHLGDGELWRVGPDVSRKHLDAEIDRVIDTSCDFNQLIERVDHALGMFLSKKVVG